MDENILGLVSEYEESSPHKETEIRAIVERFDKRALIPLFNSSPERSKLLGELEHTLKEVLHTEFDIRNIRLSDCYTIIPGFINFLGGLGNIKIKDPDPKRPRGFVTGPYIVSGKVYSLYLDEEHLGDVQIVLKPLKIFYYGLVPGARKRGKFKLDPSKDQINLVYEQRNSEEPARRDGWKEVPFP